MEKEIDLELAAFLDSPHARALRVPAPTRRALGARLLECCYVELGKKPRLLDDEDVRTLLTRLLPAHLAHEDPDAEHVPPVLGAYLDHLEESQVVPQAFEVRRGLEEHMPAFRAAVRSAETPRHAVKADPFVHGAPKLGRNDPCSCGSGKKYKKCHGRDA